MSELRGLGLAGVVGVLGIVAAMTLGHTTRRAVAPVVVPDNPRVAFDMGVVAQSEGHYREAREAYLHALALDPTMADARYNLVVLTHSIKADDEARHHLDELAAISPGDPRIPAMRAALAKP